MNKKKFISELSKGLKGLNNSEKEDILEFYDERITNGTRSGKTEEQVISELEPIEIIVRNTLKEFEIETDSSTDNVKPAVRVTDNSNNSSKSSGTSRGMSLLGLIVFDLLIASWLVPVTLVVAGVSFIIPITLFFSAFVSFITTYNFIVQIGLFIGCLSLGVISIALVRLIIQLTKFIIEYIFNVHYKVIKGTTEKKIDFNYKMASNHYKLELITSGIVLAIGGVLLISNIENIKDNFYIEPENVNETYTEEIDLNKIWDITFDSSGYILDYELYDGNEIKFVYDYFEGDDIKIRIDETENEIEFDVDQHWLSMYNFNPFQQKELANVKVYIPRGLKVDDLDIKISGDITLEFDSVQTFGDIDLSSYNGSIVLNNVISDETEIYSYNGDITLNNVKANELSVKTYNGDTSVKDIQSSNIYLKNYNGDMIIENVTAIVESNSSIKVVNYNGDITMNEVYVANANLSTYNGDIVYYNNDHTYLVNIVKASSYNGTVDISVKRHS